jgi:hypothetical protein
MWSPSSSYLGQKRCVPHKKKDFSCMLIF